MNPLCGLLALVVAREGLDDGLEAGLVEVGKGEAVPRVEADLVRRRGQEGVGHVLHHIACAPMDCQPWKLAVLMMQNLGRLQVAGEGGLK